MYLAVNDTALYVDVEGAQRRVEDGRLVTRPTIVVLHGGPGFDQAYLRPDLAGLAGRGVVGEITLPTLVVAGEYDWVCPPSASRAIAAGIPHATLCVLPDAGHFSFAEQPERFRGALTRFLFPQGPTGQRRTIVVRPS